jgi:hypothetical protein
MREFGFLLQFSTSAFEAMHKDHKKFFFSKTNKRTNYNKDDFDLNNLRSPTAVKFVFILNPFFFIFIFIILILFNSFKHFS